MLDGGVQIRRLTFSSKDKAMANYSVTKPKNSEVWRVVKDDAKRASVTADTQRKAEILAKQFAHNSGGGEVRIHKPAGPIRDSDTVAPAKDPFPPRDKKH